MSLINQALRKAQQDRSPKRMPEPGESAHASGVPATSQGIHPGLIVGLIVAVALLVGIVVGLSIVLFRGDSDAPEAPQVALEQPIVPARTALPPVEPLNPSGGEKPVSEQASSSPEPRQTLAPADPGPTVAAQAESAPGIVEELRKAREAAEAKAEAEAAAAARAAAEPKATIVEWLTQSRINGVKISDETSKVIMNGDAYAVGEYVNFGLGLKVLLVEEARVLFIDENGKKYMKRL